MLVPFMTTIMGYPMYLAVPISLCGTFGTSIGGISRYMINGYQPDWIMGCPDCSRRHHRRKSRAKDPEKAP